MKNDIMKCKFCLVLMVINIVQAAFRTLNCFHKAVIKSKIKWSIASMEIHL